MHDFWIGIIFNCFSRERRAEYRVAKFFHDFTGDVVVGDTKTNRVFFNNRKVDRDNCLQKSLR